MTNALEVCGLVKSYGDFSLKEVSFELPMGYIMGFIGPNGAGKTTTIKSILNMISYESGDIRLFGAEGKARANEELGIVMDTPFFVEDWTAADVEAAVAPFYQNWDGAEYSRLIERYAIDRRKRVKELSRGTKVKLMLAVALSHDAKLLILDEPTSGLDPVARDELCDTLSEFIADENKSVLFSTHITTDLERIADYITFILDGRIVFTGAKDSLLEKFVQVKGGLSELNAEERRLIIGIREYGTGFEGMAEAAHKDRLPAGLLFEPVTLEQIVIYMNRGGKDHE